MQAITTLPIRKEPLHIHRLKGFNWHTRTAAACVVVLKSCFQPGRGVDLDEIMTHLERDHVARVSHAKVLDLVSVHAKFAWVLNRHRLVTKHVSALEAKEVLRSRQIVLALSTNQRSWFLMQGMQEGRTSLVDFIHTETAWIPTDLLLDRAVRLYAVECLF